jgi:tRNA dimethylallyltransferase
MKTKPTIIVILGPTASGKSDVAVEIAKKFNGEIVSADSRQVYKGMDIGTGKITKREMRGVPHHLLNIAAPSRTFTVAEYQKLAHHAIRDILRRGKLPVVCGGTGFYIRAIVDNIILPEAKPDPALRRKLEKRSTAELFAMLGKLDPRRAKNIDAKNPRRLIRAIEIAKQLGKVPEMRSSPPYNAVQIGIKIDDEILKERIRVRLLKRLKQGMVAEVEKLHAHGLSWKRLENFGLEYRYVARYLQGKITEPEMTDQLYSAIVAYSKRQMTWFRKDKRITWLDPPELDKFILNLGKLGL